MANRSSFSRIIVALLMLLPAIMFGGLQLIARPDLEAWLAVQAQGCARPDAIFHVTAISYYFIVLFGITSLLAAYLVVAGKSQFLVPLAARWVGRHEIAGVADLCSEPPSRLDRNIPFGIVRGM